MLQQVEAHVGELLVGNLEGFLQKVGAERPLDEDELDIEGRLGGAVDRLDLLVGEALAFSEPGFTPGAWLILPWPTA